MGEEIKQLSRVPLIIQSFPFTTVHIGLLGSLNERLYVSGHLPGSSARLPGSVVTHRSFSEQIRFVGNGLDIF